MFSFFFINLPIFLIYSSFNFSEAQQLFWSGIHGTHYFDCSGVSCLATTLQPWDPSKYVATIEHAPYEPVESEKLYNEKAWMTAAFSDFLAEISDIDEPETCCGTNGQGCGKCLLVTNPDSENPDWSIVVMKTNRCPPWSNGCKHPNSNIDFMVPGFDNLQFSTANICGDRLRTILSKFESSILGDWYNYGSLSSQKYKCEFIKNEQLKKGCIFFTEWGWFSGNPKNLQASPVLCPQKFKDRVGNSFDKNGPVVQGSSQNEINKNSKKKCVERWGDCTSSGVTCCDAKYNCTFQNQWYSQCL